MEKVATRGSAARRAQSRRPHAVRFQVAAAAFLALCAAAPAARADAEAPPSELVLAQAEVPVAARLQMDTSNLPRLQPQDSGFQGKRVDLTLFPAARAGFAGLGAVVGVSGFNQATLPPGYPQFGPSFDIGVRWSRGPVDVTAWRRMASADDAYTLTQMQQPVYGARVELNLTPVQKAGFSADRGFVGLQLESGARIAIKRKNGGPMLYYRTTF